MELNRLRWAARRGMLELDLILSPFVENAYVSLSDAEQQLFQRLLLCEDQDLFNWFLNKEQPPNSDLQTIVQLVTQHARTVSVNQ